MKENWKYALLSLLLAVVAWYFVSGREKVETLVDVQVQLTGMPEDLVITEGLPDKMQVRVRGPKGLIRGLENKALPYSLDLSKLIKGANVFTIDKNNLGMQGNYEVVEFSPPRLTIKADEVAEKILSVIPVYTGDLDSDYELVVSGARPASVLVRGARGVLENLENARTQPVELDTDKPWEVRQKAGLDLPEEITVSPDVVEVWFRFGLKTTEVRFTLPLEVVNFSDYELEAAGPETVEVVAVVPLPMSRERDLKEKFTARVVAEGSTESGTHELPCTAATPVGVKVKEIVPATAEITLGQAKMKETTLTVPLRIGNPGGLDVLGFTPVSLRVTLRGPAPLMHQDGYPEEGVEASIDISPDLKPGQYEIKPRVSLPQECELVKVFPEVVEVEISE